MGAFVVVECDHCGMSVTWTDASSRLYKRTTRSALAEVAANGWRVPQPDGPTLCRNCHQTDKDRRDTIRR